MWQYENDCVGCERCYGCGANHAKHWYCDECGEELSEGDAFEIENKELCLCCVKKFYGLDFTK